MNYNDYIDTEIDNKSKEVIKQVAEVLETIQQTQEKKHPRDIEKFCDYIDISIETFWETVEKFRGNMWNKNEDGKLQNNVWLELEKIQ